MLVMIRKTSAAGGSASQRYRLMIHRSRVVRPMPARQTGPQTAADSFAGIDAKMTSPETCA
jgi:hypothetical protein